MDSPGERVCQSDGLPCVRMGCRVRAHPGACREQAFRDQGGMWCNYTLQRGATSSTLADAGSHLSWVLGLEALQHKLASTAHTEINADENRDARRLVRNTLLVRMLCTCAMCGS